MKKILYTFCSFAVLCTLSVIPTYAAENKIDGGPQAEMTATSDNDMIFDDNSTRDFFTDKTRGKKSHRLIQFGIFIVCILGLKPSSSGETFRSTPKLQV